MSIEKATIIDIKDLIWSCTPLGIGILVFITILIFFKPIYKLLLNIVELKFNFKDKSLELKGCEPKPDVELLSHEVLICEQGKVNEINIKSESNSLPSTTNEEENKDFESKFIESYNKKDKKMMEVNLKGWIEQQSDIIDQNEVQCLGFYYFYKIGDLGVIKKYEEIINNNNNHEILTNAYFWLGNCYQEGNNLEKAIKCFEKVIEIKKDAKGSYENLGICLLDLGKTEKEATEKLLIKINLLEKENKRDDLNIYYTILSKLYNKSGNKHAKVFSLLKALENSPNNTNLLFDIAYSLKELGEEFQTISFLFYKTLLDFEPENTSVLNNIGIIYSDFKLHIHSVDMYKRAIKKNNTLTSSNLAYKYIDNGFYAEAESLLNEASKIDNHNVDIGKAYSYIIDQKEKEKKTEINILNKSKQNREFFSRYASSLFNVSSISENNNGIWNDDHEVKLIEKNKIEIYFEINSTKYKYEAILNNLAGRGNVFEYKYVNSWTTNLCKDFVKLNDIYLYLDEVKNEIQIYDCKSNSIKILGRQF